MTNSEAATVKCLFTAVGSISHPSRGKVGGEGCLAASPLPLDISPLQEPTACPQIKEAISKQAGLRARQIPWSPIIAASFKSNNCAQGGGGGHMRDA